MKDAFSPDDEALLEVFFAPPNGISWESITQRTAPSALLDQILPWLDLLREDRREGPIVLPFVRGGKVVGWYGAPLSPTGYYEFENELNAWLGCSYLKQIEPVPESAGYPLAAALRKRFGPRILQFSGESEAAISARLLDYAQLMSRRPKTGGTPVRPVGAIRSDFDRALIARDSVRAEELIEEFKLTGRLNEENLRYLDVRLKAGLGYWEAIARAPSFLRTLADLPLPKQVLSDLIESLYRTYLDPEEATGNFERLTALFAENIGGAYPKLFSSRKGIRTPRVVKAFMLFELMQNRPDRAILTELEALIPAEDPGASVFRSLVDGAGTPPSTEPSPAKDEAEVDAAETAYLDEQYDRAFALFKGRPLSKSAVQRQVHCVLFIDTDEARRDFLDRIEAADEALLASLTEAARRKIEAWRQSCLPTQGANARQAGISGWLEWAEALSSGTNPAEARATLEKCITWDRQAIADDRETAHRFTALLSGLAGDAEQVARHAVPAILEAFVPEDKPLSEAGRPIATLLFDLIALDDRVTPTDLSLLQLLAILLLNSGLSGDEYRDLVSSLEDVLNRVGSYTNLTWGLDMAEALAIAPAPSPQARARRQGFFLQLVGQAQQFAHRLSRHEVIGFFHLCRDFDVERVDLGIITLPREDATTAPTPDLSGKLIGIYTLTEAAAQRARATLLEMFPRVRVETNADQVASARLISLAKAADIFVFAWKSSSHQAYYCVKDAMKPREPILPTGKGTASLVRAVLDLFS
jgi:hypothetical protein